nr:MAG TPA: hypothetical protein [Caudoviricetes sp.]
MVIDVLALLTTKGYNKHLWARGEQTLWFGVKF